MKYMFVFIIFISNLFGVNINQVFNKEVISVKKNIYEHKERYFGEVKLNEAKVYDIRLRFNGFVDGINKNKTYLKVSKGDILFNAYSEEVLKTINEYKISKQKSILKKLKNLEVNILDIKKDNIAIKSKFNGYIIDKKINENGYFKKGDLLYSIADLSDLWIEGDYFQKDIPLFKEGLDVVIKVNGEKISSKIDFLYPEIQNKKGKFRVSIKDKKIMPGMFVEIDVIFSKKEILWLPDSSVLKKKDKFYVFKVEGEDVYPVEIIASKKKDKYEIVSGIEEGEKVINNALFLLDSDAMMNKLYEAKDEEW